MNFLEKAKALAKQKAEQLERDKLASMPETEIVDDIEIPEEPSEPTRKDLKLDADQLAAVELGCSAQYCNIVGSAGTGKTSTVMKLISTLADRGIVKSFMDRNRIPPEHLKHNTKSLSIGICAFTAKAANTIQRSVDNAYKPYCYTIHKLLDYGPDVVEVKATKDDVEKRKADYVGEPIEKRVMIPRRNADKQLPFDVVVIDEVSMAGMSLLSKLFEALDKDCRIICIGDLAQLTPVLDTPSFPLLINSWPTQELRTIYRQKDGDLIDNANKIRTGDNPSINENFRAVAIPKDELEASRFVTNFIQKEYNEGRYDPDLDLLITPQNVGLLGQEVLNVKARVYLNPDNPVQSIRTMHGIERFAVGDRVVNRKNDYEIGVTNGMCGEIKEINLNAGMAKFSDTGLQSEQQKLDLEDELNKAVTDLEKQQRDKATQAKLSSFNLTGFGRQQELPDEPEDEDGTRKRMASHSIKTQFDYLEEDSKDGLDYLIQMHQSTQITNVQLGWWITVYIAQGSSARNVYVLLHPSHAKALNREMLYTAVTRAQDNIILLTTNVAVKKALRSQLIKGDTLSEKIENYLAKLKREKKKIDFDIPQERG